MRVKLYREMVTEPKLFLFTEGVDDGGEPSNSVRVFTNTTGGMTDYSDHHLSER